MAEAAHYHDVLEAIREPAGELRRAQPEAWRGFAALHRAAFAEGELTRAMKELIALAIAVCSRCEGCVASHARGAAAAGATEAQVAEALSVALLMGGGPASTFAPRAWEAYHEFAAPAEAAPIANRQAS